MSNEDVMMGVYDDTVGCGNSDPVKTTLDDNSSVVSQTNDTVVSAPSNPNMAIESLNSFNNVLKEVSKASTRLCTLAETPISKLTRLGQERDKLTKPLLDEHARVVHELGSLKELFEKVNYFQAQAEKAGMGTVETLVDTYRTITTCSQTLRCNRSDITTSLKNTVTEHTNMLSTIQTLIDLTGPETNLDNLVDTVQDTLSQKLSLESRVEELESQIVMSKQLSDTFQAGDFASAARAVASQHRGQGTDQAAAGLSKPHSHTFANLELDRAIAESVIGSHGGNSYKFQFSNEKPRNSQEEMQSKLSSRHTGLLLNTCDVGGLRVGSEKSDSDNLTSVSRCFNGPNQVSAVEYLMRGQLSGAAPNFSGDRGESLDDYLKAFHLRYPKGVWSEEDLLILLVEKLKGKARVHYETLSRSDRSTFTGVVAGLKQKLQGDKQLSMLQALNKLQFMRFDCSKQSLLEFIIEFERVCDVAYRGQTVQSQTQLMMGQHFYRILVGANWRQCDPILEVLEGNGEAKYDLIRDMVLRQDRARESREAIQKELKRPINVPKQTFTPMPKPHETNKATPGRKPEESKGRWSKQCYFCKKNGNIENECRTKQAQERSRHEGDRIPTQVRPPWRGSDDVRSAPVPLRPPPNPVGHKIMRTTDVVTDGKANDTLVAQISGIVVSCQTLQAQEGFKIVRVPQDNLVGGRPTCSIQLLSKRTEALIDSGAQISTISSKFLIDLVKSGVDVVSMITQLPNTKGVRVFDASGNEMEFKKVISTPIQILPGGKSHDVVLYVVDHMPDEPLLIGTNAMAQLGIELIHTSSEGVSKTIPILPTTVVDSASINVGENVNVKAIYAKNRVVIPPQEEKVLQLYTSEQSSLIGQAVMLWSADEDKLESGVVHLDDMGKVSIRVCNMSSKPIKFDKKQVVGHANSQDKWKYMADEDVVDMLDHSRDRIALSDQQRSLKLLEVLQARNELSERLKDLIMEYADVFALEDHELKSTTVTSHDINTGETSPIRQKPRPVPLGAKPKFRELIQDLLDRKIIEKSESPWASPIVLVMKKDGNIRLCIDYRELNKHIKLDSYPLPRIDDLLQSLCGRQVFSTLDLHSGFWQVPMAIEAREKTAFTTTEGLYQFKVLPFGLATSPAVFQRLMSTVLEDVEAELHEVQYYIDDVLIATNTVERHMVVLRRVFEAFRKANLSLKPSKCEFLRTEVKYLGHLINGSGVNADPDKVNAIRNYPRPETVTEMRSFLGLCSYYRKFVLRFGSVTKPLNELTSSTTKWEWTKERVEAFNKMKDIMSKAPVLSQPDLEGARSGSNPFLLYTDACGTGVGAVLCQKGKDDFLHPIHFVSKSLNKHEAKYTITDLEGLDVVHAVQRLRSYLYDMHVIVKTDHQPLTAFFKSTTYGRVVRWALALQSYNKLKIEYVPGKANVVADALSRGTPIRETGDTSPTCEGQPECALLTQHVQVIPSGIMGSEDWSSLLKGDVDYKQLFQLLNKSRIDTVKLPRIQKKLSSREFHIQAGYLIFNGHDGRQMKVVPKQLRKKLYEEVHAGFFGGHFSPKKILDRLRKEYFWEGMACDVNQWHASCTQCYLTNCRTSNTPPLKPIVTSEPYEIVGVDLMELGLTHSGNRYVLVAVDHFSKWLGAYPIPTKTAEVVAETLVSRWICEGGRWPKQFLSDMGSEFMNQVIEHVKQLTKIDWVTTKGYNPRENGLVERANGTIKNALKKCVRFVNDWDKVLPCVVYAYNTSRHETTGESPFFLLHGRDPVLVTSVDKPPPVSVYVDTDDYKTALVEGVRMAHEVAIESTKREAQIVKDHYDKANKVDRSWTPMVGNRVFMKVPSQHLRGDNPKLLCEYSGPYRVIEVSENSALITDIQGKQEAMQIPLDQIVRTPDSIGNEPVGPRLQRGKRGRKPREKDIVAKCNSICFRSGISDDLNAMLSDAAKDLEKRWTSEDSSHPCFKCTNEKILLADGSERPSCCMVSTTSLTDVLQKLELSSYMPKRCHSIGIESVSNLAHIVAICEDLKKKSLTPERADKLIRFREHHWATQESIRAAYLLMAEICEHTERKLDEPRRPPTEGSGIPLSHLTVVQLRSAFTEAQQIRKEQDRPVIPKFFYVEEDIIQLVRNVVIADGPVKFFKTFSDLSALIRRNAETYDDSQHYLMLGARKSYIDCKLVDVLPTDAVFHVTVHLCPLPWGLAGSSEMHHKVSRELLAMSEFAEESGVYLINHFPHKPVEFCASNILGSDPASGDGRLRYFLFEKYWSKMSEELKTALPNPLSEVKRDSQAPPKHKLNEDKLLSRLGKSEPGRSFESAGSLRGAKHRGRGNLRGSRGNRGGRPMIPRGGKS